MQNSQITIDRNGFVFLTIRNGYKNSRRIGIIKGDSFHTTKYRDKNLFILNNSIEITSSLFEVAEIQYFCIKLDGVPHWIHKDYANAVKIQMYWNKSNLENQFFIRLDDFSSFKAEADNKLNRNIREIYSNKIKSFAIAYKSAQEALF